MERIFKFRAWHNKAKKMLESGSPRYVFTWKDDGQDITIMQFTGLCDKNGKEIYEGDILEWRRYRFEVRFNNGEYYGYPFLNNEIPGDLSCGHFYESEIIGNVFQNPELLND